MNLTQRLAETYALLDRGSYQHGYKYKDEDGESWNWFATDSAKVADAIQMAKEHGYRARYVIELSAEEMQEHVARRESVSLVLKDTWLLEKKINEVSHWIGVEGGMFRWLLDKNKALKLATREDADKLAEIIDDAESVVGWIAP